MVDCCLWNATGHVWLALDVQGHGRTLSTGCAWVLSTSSCSPCSTAARTSGDEPSKASCSAGSNRAPHNVKHETIVLLQ